MKKLLISFFLLAVVLVLGLVFQSQDPSKPCIGVIVPMEHAALSEIVQGIEEQLKDRDIRIKICNAQGDSNIQKALIEKLIREKCDLFVPIGTSTSQMTLHLAEQRKVLCLAADPSVVSSQTRTQATVLDDAFSIEEYFRFFKKAFPHIKKISLVYSSSEKVAREIPLLEKTEESYQIEIEKLMVHNMQDLYTISSAMSFDSQAIFVLKDHLVVSGIATLVNQAAQKKVFVMTSDEGSISSGGAFALGVKESEIGKKGGEIAAKILEGLSPSSIAPQTMNGPCLLFVNRSACEKQGVDLSSLVQTAKTVNMNVQFVGENHVD